MTPSNKFGKSTRDVILGKRRTPVKKSPIKHSNKLDRTTSKEYMTQHEFSMRPVQWTLKESITLSQLLLKKNICEPYTAAKVKKITLLFNSIVEKNPSLGAVKEANQIRSKLVHNKKVMSD